jgi:hypothetical protein
MESYAQMLSYFGFNSMEEFMYQYGLYSLLDAKRMLVSMYEEAVVED